MTRIELDARHTFENFVVGAGNSLAVGAARRVAESPGSTYNPFFIYSASGLGKTHLVTAIGHHTRRLLPEIEVQYDTLERFMEEVLHAIEAGERDSFRARLGSVGLLILDDVQFLAGRHRTQEELLRVWDIVSANGGQVVLTSDRPPQEIDGLDERLLSRFSGGLIVDIGVPDYETRAAITRRKAEERGQRLGTGVAETLARIAFSNVRELQGALNRILAVQELEDRQVEPDEVAALLGRVASASQLDEFDSFLAEITDTLTEVVSEDEGGDELEQAIERWQAEGFATRRLETGLSRELGAEEVGELIGGYESDLERLKALESEIVKLDPDSPELGRREILSDPDRIMEAEALLGMVRLRCSPLPRPPAGDQFASLQLSPEAFEFRVALAVSEAPGQEYNPLYIQGPEGSERRSMLAAIGNRVLELDPGMEVTYLAGESFIAELIEAIEQNQVEGWRARYRRSKVFLLENVSALADTERAQDELFHLFDELQRSGAQLIFTGEAEPEQLTGLADRLRTRLGSGLVITLPTMHSGSAREGEGAPLSVVDRSDPWFLDPEKVVTEWPYPEGLIVEDWS